ncbi:uncharacterized protein LOC128554228 [Mercenaria mercenaria]|uniref:uncharacterized protein LOC128554228 n=1 Tax=Mercenaria mercenaria TaxID=6596 RepID=UPI00234EEB44|nr:uncharacterized protein LOC128554228 [Mercenaria mercenaria]
MLVCKGIIDKELKFKETALHVVLKPHEKKLKLLKYQKLILFPENGNPHVDDLDLSLLTFVLQNVMDLSDTEKENVKVIKETRNTLAHTSTASIEIAKYKTLKKDLEDALERLCLGLDVSLQTECSTLIQKFTSDSLDEATALKYAKEMRDEDELLQNLAGMLEEHSTRIVQELQASENRIQETLSDIQLSVTEGLQKLQAPPRDEKIQDLQETDETEDMGTCDQHKERISFFCETENTLCCHVCKKEQHEKCKGIQPVSEEILEWKCNPALEIQRLQTEARLLGNWISSVEKVHKKGEDILLVKFDARRKTFQEHTEKKEKLLKRKAKLVRDMTSIEIEGNRSHCEDFIVKTEQAKLSLINMAQSDKKTENVIAKLTLQKFVNDLNSFSDISLPSFNFDSLEFDWKFDHTEWTKILKTVSPEQSPVQLCLISSTETKSTKDDEKEPFYSGIDYLLDGRLVAVDNNNRKCVVFNEKLQKVGSHQLSYFPQSLVAVSEEQVAITSGGCYKIDILRVSKSSEITLIRRCKVTAKYDSICLKDDGHFVVGTSDDSRIFRFLSLSGREKDYSYLNKKDPECKIKCTYIRNRKNVAVTDTKNVFLFDIATKKKVVVDEDARIVSPKGVAVGPFDCIFVCSRETNSIVQISHLGHILKSHEIDMLSPCTICFSQDKTKLAVANSVWGRKCLQVFEVVIRYM